MQRFNLEDDDLGLHNRPDWSIVYEGTNSMAEIHELDARFAYRARVFALNAVGDCSVPGLPTQFSVSLRPKGKILYPRNASKYFTVAVRDRDIVLSDMLVFTEAARSDCSGMGPGILRTIAARVVKWHEMKDTLLTLQVEWTSVARTAECNEKEKLELARGDKITRKIDEIFALSDVYPAYRMPWFEESMRWTRAEEESL